MKYRGIIRALALTLAFNVAAPPLARAQGPNSRTAAIVVDASDGRVLSENAANELRYPASTTKLMTLYLSFQALKNHVLAMEEILPVSAEASNRESTHITSVTQEKQVVTTNARGRKTYRTIKQNKQVVFEISAHDAIIGMIVHSANDAAVVMAERIAGSEQAFVSLMNETARRLGMDSTTYKTANGLPDAGQVTTVSDQVKLAQALLRDFPEYYPLFSTPSFTFNGITYRSTNPLLGKYRGLDGMKTGWIRSSGYNLVASAERGGHRLIAILFGADTIPERNADIRRMLDDGFKKVLPPPPAPVKKPVPSRR